MSNVSFTMCFDCGLWSMTLVAWRFRGYGLSRYFLVTLWLVLKRGCSSTTVHPK